MPDPWRCPYCGLLNWPPATYCPRCGTDDRTQPITGPRRRAVPVALVLILAALICAALWQGLQSLSEAGSRDEVSIPAVPQKSSDYPTPPRLVPRVWIPGSPLPARVRVNADRIAGSDYYSRGDVLLGSHFRPAETRRMLDRGELIPVDELTPLTFGN